MDQKVLTFYATPGRFTSLRSDEFASSDISKVVEVVQGLLVYDVVAQPFYGVTLDPTQAEAIHERDSECLLARVRALDPRPIDQARPPAKRIGARCHGYSRLTVAFLRAAGIPARARCGFGAYFRSGWYEDHWIAEFWNEPEARWQRVDAQLDATWCKALAFKGEPFEITESEFLTAASAWQAWRHGELDASRCGLSGVDEHGAHWIAGNLRLDLASLNKVEMLPWDLWGARWGPDERPTDAQLELFDAVAELTVDPDTRFDDVTSRYEGNALLRVDGEVFNVLRERLECI